MFLSLVASVSSLALDLLLSLIKVYREKRPWTGRLNFLDEFFPRTGVGIMDLDQAVALLAGMTVLGLSYFHIGMST
jgi:hypothetical protein